MDKIILKENEELIFPIVWTGKENEMSFNFILSNPGANITVLGLLLGNGSNQLNLNINVVHSARNTKSIILLKGAITDTSKINFEGLVKIEKNAKQTDAYLACHLLLLSEMAKGRAIPSLEILENDIKAGHATTVGRVDDIQLFYLMSRGIEKEKAKKIIVKGFFQSIVEKMPQKFIKDLDKNFYNYEKHN